MTHVVKPKVKPYPGMIITESVTFEPGEYSFTDGRGLIVAGDGIEIDGNGAVIRGRGKEGNKYSYWGIGLFANGRSRVTVSNLTISGFQIGMKVMNGTEWAIVGNDLSHNYTDPDFGWGDGEPFGALVLEHVSHSRITGNKGNKVWNGLNMKDCDYNVVTDNEMGHCTNVCLKLWRSSHNEITNNVMNYGIRISPGEVHARDSSSVLIENGSNYNVFKHNDFTHGGDGVFIRSLNGWVSRFNIFEGNDASYAHNNAWEVWDPDNTFVNNKGNYSSYGFWLGGSCHAVLIGNEAAYNGTRIANAPEPFGNAGIAVVNGSSSHFVMRNNYVHHNKSAGVAIGFKEGYEAYHWIIEQNTITDNATYGIFLKHSNWIQISGNTFENNALGDVHQDVNVSNVILRPLPAKEVTGTPPKAIAKVTTLEPAAGRPVRIDAGMSENPDGGELSFRWEMGDGTVLEGAEAVHTYAESGFYRAGLTVTNGSLSDLTWIDLYVVPDRSAVVHTVDIGSAGIAEDHCTRLRLDDRHCVQSGPSAHIESVSTLSRVRFPISCPRLSDAKMLQFWMSYRHEVRDGFGHGMLTVRLGQDGDNYIEYINNAPIFNWGKIASEARYGWRPMQIPIADRGTVESWSVSSKGAPDLNKLQYVEIQIGSHEGRYHIWLDEIAFL
ncbi:right-handed parallel beta-helix repeat-containing protein [Paenibacillus thermotolerans]|uniref:right-handed parallel beta-helix repeat-containing protein n=1 Tax=Paenibacillus thermotolerans TaxID=3027807 RepID=UPI002367A18B|nr:MULTISPECIES: right-handed parallel beta-helix repeat-containing protein [unclassified Paenibacillus]